MLAKKSKHFINTTIEKTGEKEELVEDLVYYFYKYVKKKISTMSDTEIRIKRLGNFILSVPRMKNALKTRQSKLKYMKSEKIRQDLQNDIDLIEVKIKELEELYKKRREFYNERDEKKYNKGISE